MIEWIKAWVVFVVTASLSATTLGAPISWQPIVDIKSVDDISLAGNLVEARNATSDGISPVVFTATEVIEFVAQQFPTNTTPTVGFFTREGGDTGSFELNMVLDSQAFGPEFVFSLTGLQVGSEYQIQIIAGGDTRSNLGELNQRAGDAESLESFSDDFSRGGVGSAIGTFTADDTTQMIHIIPGTGNPQFAAISGYVLRMFEPPTPPSDILLSHDRIDPASPSGSFIATLDAIDLNDTTGDTHSFELVSDAAFPDHALFTITNGNQLRAAADLGDVGTSYVLRIRATDSTSLILEKSLNLSVLSIPQITKIEHSQSMLRA